MAAVRRKHHKSSTEVWEALSREGSVCGSEISSIRVPVEKEAAVEDLPTNLSDILKQVNELKANGGALMLDSREELMDIGPLETSASYGELNIEDIPATDEAFTQKMHSDISQYVASHGRKISIVNMEDPNEADMLKAIAEIELQQKKSVQTDTQTKP